MRTRGVRLPSYRGTSRLSPVVVMQPAKDGNGSDCSSHSALGRRSANRGPPDVVKATVVGLLRGRKLRVRMPEGIELTSVRDEGAR